MKFSSLLPSAFSKRFSLMTVALLLIAGGGCIYYFLYLNEREKNLDEHYRRAAEHAQANIEANIAGQFSMAGGSAYSAAYALREKIDRNPSLEIAMDSIRLDPDAPWGKKNSHLRLDSIEKMSPGPERLWMEQDPKSDTAFYFTKQLPWPFPISASDSADVPRMLYLKFRTTLSYFVAPALQKNVFDGFLVTKDDSVVYETMPTGLEQLEDDSLFQVSKDGKKAGTPRLNIAGKEYRCYVQPFKIDNERGWNIIGLKSSESFAEAKNNIPRWLRFGVFLVVLFAILSVPFFKSLVMSRTERLQPYDVLFSVFSLVVLVSLVALLLFDGYLHYSADRFETETRLQDLSDSLHDNLHKEITAIYKELGSFDDSVSKKPGPYKHYYSGYSFIFMVDTNGRTCHDPKDPLYPFDVSNRSYFRNVRDKNFSYLQPGEDPFALETIISWREGKLRTAISRPHNRTSPKDPLVASALTADLQSLNWPILPRDVGFCLLESNGKVIFHSEADKSLNENFLDECEMHPGLVSAINARRASTFDAEYSSSRVTLHVRPFGHTKYFIVAFSRQAPVDNMHGQVFGVSMALQMAAVILYLLITLLIAYLARLRSRRDSVHFGFAFFLPMRLKTRRYVKAGVYNLSHALLLMAVNYFGHAYPTLVLFTFFTAPVFTVLFNYFLLSGEDLRAKKESARRSTSAAAGGILFLVNLLALQYLDLSDSYWLFLLYQLIAVAAYLVVTKTSHERLSRGVNYKQSYMMMIYMLVVLVCVMPVTRFAILAFDTEKEIAVKTAQIDMAAAFAARIGHDNICDTLSGSAADPGNYAASFYNTQIIRRPDIAALCWLDSSEAYGKISPALRAAIQEAGARSRLFGAGAADHSWRWGKTKEGKLTLVLFSPLTVQACRETFAFASDVPVFQVPALKKATAVNTIRSWFILLLLLLLLYVALQFFVRKLFAPGAFAGRLFPNIDLRFFNERDPAYRVFVTGLPCSGKSKHFLQLYKDQPGFQVLDLIGCEEGQGWKARVHAALSDPGGVLLIDHFEYDCLNQETNKLKLELLEELATMPGKRVVILSAIHPQAFLELYTTPGVTEQTLDGKQLQAGDRWNKALSCFYNLWFPIEGVASEEQEALKQLARTIPREFRKTILQECSHGLFLRKIGEELCRELAGWQPEPDPKRLRKKQRDLVHKIQQLAHVYYLSIWALLTKEEQYVLFDLAQDGLVNSKNLDVIETLVSKGLVLNRHCPVLMNRSFQNFILAVIEPGDLMKIEQAVRDAGNWDKLKKPLLIIVAALIVFIFRTDQNSEMLTYITGFAASIPIILNLIASLGKLVKTK